MGCSPPGSPIHGILQARILEWVAVHFFRDLPNTGIEPRSSSLQANSLPSEPQGTPKNSGVGSLSHLQRIILMQESNWGLLHCRQILYQLSYLQETRVQSLDGEDPWRREWQTTPVFLPGESHGWGSLVGYSPQGRKESDMTERLHFHFPFFSLPRHLRTPPYSAFGIIYLSSHFCLSP